MRMSKGYRDALLRGSNRRIQKMQEQGGLRAQKPFTIRPTYDEKLINEDPDAIIHRWRKLDTLGLTGRAAIAPIFWTAHKFSDQALRNLTGDEV